VSAQTEKEKTPYLIELFCVPAFGAMTFRQVYPSFTLVLFKETFGLIFELFSFS
jgi:hypothetical protein